MVKYNSVLFSEASGKLGNTAVFSKWKGRNYIRGYKTPSNPKTVKQVAQRNLLSALVARYQSLIADPDVKTAWNNAGLSLNLPGFNIFTKYGASSKIEIVDAGGAGPIDVTVKYTLGIPANLAKIFRFDGATYTDITPGGGLSSDADSTFDDQAQDNKTNTYFIAHKDVLKSGDATPQAYQAITKWKKDVSTGLLVEATIVIS